MGLQSGVSGWWNYVGSTAEKSRCRVARPSERGQSPRQGLLLWFGGTTLEDDEDEDEDEDENEGDEAIGRLQLLQLSKCLLWVGKAGGDAGDSMAAGGVGASVS
ncbi:hypothetical protein MAPG_04395 [Magnaporthiopsis poae ATCC 64411]|uniref:Uncharacterized protein n=1 Tax=Magnaporthiopsis poae (strain ATCC 64411 / 73-15) TaxID=644358 RepID=A0A0C4DWL5_MAGP6|nr:hypothetical protein MAPG_04395 [Magnaporthiopsis poae ATCC 64411]